MFSFMTFNDAYSKQSHKSIIMDTTRTYKISMKDQSEFIGQCVKNDSVFLIIKTISPAKIFEIQISNIKNIEEIEPPTYDNGVYWYGNPNASRYLYSSSAINLKKGKGYYQNTYLLLNSLAYGITDNISITAGFELLSITSSLDNGNFNPVYFISPKVGFKVNDYLHLGGGFLYTSGYDFIYHTHGGLSFLYGVGTVGNTNSNVSLSFGWGAEKWEVTKEPFIGMSGTIRLEKNISFITDNYFIPTHQTASHTGDKFVSYQGFYSYGFRFF